MSRTKKTVQKPDAADLQAALLGWYDRHRRVMPWRAGKGRRPDPYHVWLSEIMLQQTTVATVGPYFMKFVEKWPTVGALARAKQDDVLTAWAGLGYYARARNLHKCAQAVVRDHGGKFPQTEEELLALPGIGPYTAAAIASIAFDRPAVAVDGNVERVVARFCRIEEPLPLSKPAIRQGAAALAAGCGRPGDFTQAFMELGATVCTPRKPKCGLCPWRGGCRAMAEGADPETLPRKMPKAVKPRRYGKVFWVTDAQGRVLIEKRTEKGLYEGLYQLPTTEWIADRGAAEELKAPFARRLKMEAVSETVRHSFTHFDLTLAVYCAAAPVRQPLQPLSGRGKWVSVKKLDEYALPTLMKKAARLCLGRKG
jgi:A/G-specific adenine glycosylase